MKRLKTLNTSFFENIYLQKNNHTIYRHLEISQKNDPQSNKEKMGKGNMLWHIVKYIQLKTLSGHTLSDIKVTKQEILREET